MQKLEQAAKKYENSFIYADGTESVDFIAGAKWQQKRMYEKHKVNEMFNTLKRNSINKEVFIKNIDLYIDSWKRELDKKNNKKEIYKDFSSFLKQLLLCWVILFVIIFIALLLKQI